MIGKRPRLIGGCPCWIGKRPCLIGNRPCLIGKQGSFLSRLFVPFYLMRCVCARFVLAPRPTAVGEPLKLGRFVPASFVLARFVFCFVFSHRGRHAVGEPPMLGRRSEPSVATSSAYSTWGGNTSSEYGR